jgi:dTDP-4-dehydrorhamnose reductase
VTGFLDIKILSNFIKAAIDSNLTNRLIQVSSSDYMTRYEFAKIYAQVFHKNSDLVVKTNWKFPINENQAKMNKTQDRYYYKMSIANAEDFLGHRLPTIEESLQFTKVRLS